MDDMTECVFTKFEFQRHILLCISPIIRHTLLTKTSTIYMCRLDLSGSIWVRTCICSHHPIWKTDMIYTYMHIHILFPYLMFAGRHAIHIAEDFPLSTCIGKKCFQFCGLSLIRVSCHPWREWRGLYTDPWQTPSFCSANKDIHLEPPGAALTDSIHPSCVLGKQVQPTVFCWIQTLM